jgi:hypothetical protein
MLPAAVGILVLGLIVFLVGIISARNSARGRRQRLGAATTEERNTVWQDFGSRAESREP